MSENILYLTGCLTFEKISDLRTKIHNLRTNVEEVKILIHGNTEGSGLIEAMEIYRQSKDAKITLPRLHTIAGPGVSTAGFFIFLAGGERTLLPNVSLQLSWNVGTIDAITESSGKQREEIIKIFRSGLPLDSFRTRRLGIHTGNYVGSVKPITRTIVGKI